MAYCGMDCSICPAKVATEQDDQGTLSRVAEQFSRFYGCALLPEDIRCEGCHSEEGVHFVFCKSCQIRECASSKGLTHCGECEDYRCEQLEAFHHIVPAAEERLNRNREHEKL